MNKLSRVSFFLFIFLYNFLWIRAVFIDYLYNYYGNIAFLCGLILTLIILGSLLIIPKELYKLDFSKYYLNSKVKYLINSLMIIEGVISGLYSLDILIECFHLDISFILYILLLGFCICYISRGKVVDIVQISVMFGMVSLLLYGLSYIYYIDVDINLLFPIVKNKYLNLFMYSSAFIGNNSLLFLVERDNFNKGKKFFVVSIIFSLIIMILEILMLIITTGDTFLKEYEWIGFLVLSIKPVAKYVGNFDFAYIFIIVSSLIFKLSFNICVIKNSFNKNCIWLLGILFVVLSVISYFYFPVVKNNNAVLGILSGEYLIIIWYFKVKYNVRKIKE